MVTITIAFVLLLIFIWFYRRVVPVRGVKCTNPQHLKEGTKILDIRDYHIASHHPVTGAVNIPFAYIKRYFQPFIGSEVIIISNDVVAKNLCIRFLKQKGVHVTGYYISNPDTNRKKYAELC
ncbi:MAG: rhodanese-like domain-containing protein [Bacillaceae bacterium]|nr:rhodanese-like domain-containing protein [Bacillaceae bacterium]